MPLEELQQLTKFNLHKLYDLFNDKIQPSAPPRVLYQQPTQNFIPISHSSLSHVSHFDHSRFNGESRVYIGVSADDHLCSYILNLNHTPLTSLCSLEKLPSGSYALFKKIQQYARNHLPKAQQHSRVEQAIKNLLENRVELLIYASLHKEERILAIKAMLDKPL